MQRFQIVSSESGESTGVTSWPFSNKRWSTGVTGGGACNFWPLVTVKSHQGLVPDLYPQNPTAIHGDPVPIYSLGLDKTNFLRILTPLGKRGQQIHNSYSLDLYTEFLNQTNFPQTRIPRARYTRELSTIPTRSRPFAWLSCGVPLLGHPARVSCRYTPWIFPEYCPHPVGQWGQQYPQLALGPVPELWLRGRQPGGQKYV